MDLMVDDFLNKTTKEEKKRKEFQKYNKENRSLKKKKINLIFCFLLLDLKKINLIFTKDQVTS